MMFIRFLCFVAILALPQLALAQTGFAHGNGALELFDRQGLENSPQWVRLWVIVMGLTFLAGLAFVKNHAIARWVLGGFAVGVIVMIISTQIFGMPMLSGFIALIHVIFWTPGLYMLLKARPFFGKRSAFSIWSGAITAVIIFSFIFDVRDAFLYLQHIL